MADTPFHRAWSFRKNAGAGRALGIVCGVAAGALYVGWMVLLLLFAELLLDQGTCNATGAGAQLAWELTGGKGGRNTYHAIDSGMLPLVVDSRDSWYGDSIAKFYRNAPWTHANGSYALGLALAALAIGALRVLLIYWQHLVAASDTTTTIAALQRAIFKRKFEMGSESFDRDDKANVEPLLTEHLPAVHRGLVEWGRIVYREPAKIVFLLGFILILNPLLGLSFFIMAAIAWLLGSGLARRVVTRRQELAAKADEELQRLFGLASKHRLVRGYAAEEYVSKQFEKHLDGYAESTGRQLRYEGGVAPLWQFLGMLVFISVVALSAQNILTRRFSLASAVGVFGSILSLGLPARRFVELRKTVRSADKSAAEVFNFLDLPAGRQPVAGSNFLDPMSKSIEFDRVSFRDADGELVLDEIDIKLPAGKRYSLLSTGERDARAFFLLGRFVDPTTGVIRFDGKQLSEFTIESLRSQVCTVLQSDLLLPDTVANNIGLGDSSFSEQRIVEAAKLAHAHHFIQKLPRGYDCHVGAGGFPLKTSEQFRLALARALLRDPPVLIVEEPHEGLDDDTKALLDDTAARCYGGRTVVVLPRRLSTVRSSDRVLLLDGGRLAASGSHRDLVENSPLYRHLEYTRFQNLQGQSNGA